jgi:hypothetical protein
MNKIGILIFIVFLIGNVMALESYTPQQVNQQFTFCQVCSDATYITLSSIQTPTTIVYVDANMTSVGSGQYCYNYTGNISGRYDFRGISDGCDKTYATYVDMSPVIGSENNTTFFLVLAISSVVLLLLGFILNNYIFAFFSGILFLITGVYGMIYGLSDVTNLYTRMISLVVIGIGAIITILSSLELLRSVEGGSVDDDFDYN